MRACSLAITSFSDCTENTWSIWCAARIVAKVSHSEIRECQWKWNSGTVLKGSLQCWRFIDLIACAWRNIPSNRKAFQQKKRELKNPQWQKWAYHCRKTPSVAECKLSRTPLCKMSCVSRRRPGIRSISIYMSPHYYFPCSICYDRQRRLGQE